MPMLLINILVAIFFLVYSLSTFLINRESPLQHAIMRILLMVIVLGSLYLIYFKFLDGVVVNKVVTFQSDQLNLKTEKPSYKPGEMVKAYVSFCKNRDLVANVSDALVDDVLILFTEKPISSNIIGCKTDLLVSFEPIPLETLPGTYHLTRTIRYQVNPLNFIEIPLKTADFKVVR